MTYDHAIARNFEPVCLFVCLFFFTEIKPCLFYLTGEFFVLRGVEMEAQGAKAQLESRAKVSQINKCQALK